MRTESRELLAVGILGSKSRRFESGLGDRIETLQRRDHAFSPRVSAHSVAASAIVLIAPGVGGNSLRFGGATYDIEAKASEQDPRFKAAEAAGPGAWPEGRRQGETKQALQDAKGGPKLKVSTGARPEERSISAGRGRPKGQKAPLSMLAAQLTRVAGRTVTDETGLEGGFDFNLEWTPEETPTNLASALSIFTAILEQLGLILETRKEKAENLVIDHVEKPDAR